MKNPSNSDVTVVKSSVPEHGFFTRKERSLVQLNQNSEEGSRPFWVRVGFREDALLRQKILSEHGIDARRGRDDDDSGVYYLTLSTKDWNEEMRKPPKPEDCDIGGEHSNSTIPYHRKSFIGGPEIRHYFMGLDTDNPGKARFLTYVSLREGEEDYVNEVMDDGCRYTVDVQDFTSACDTVDKDTRRSSGEIASIKAALQEMQSALANTGPRTPPQSRRKAWLPRFSR